MNIDRRQHRTLRWLSLAITALLVSALSAVLWRGDFAHSLFVLGGLVYIGVPALAAGVFFASMSRRLDWVAGSTLASRCLGVALFLLLQLPGLLVGNCLAAADLRFGRRYCEGLVPKLEGWKQSHGTFPENVEQVTDSGARAPRLLRGARFYESYGTNFEFSIPDRTAFSTIWIYFSHKKSWMKD